MSALRQFLALVTAPLGLASTVLERIAVITTVLALTGLSIMQPWYWVLTLSVIAALLLLAGVRLQRRWEEAHKPRLETCDVRGGRALRIPVNEQYMDVATGVYTRQVTRNSGMQPYAVRWFVRNNPRLHIATAVVTNAWIAVEFEDQAGNTVWNTTKGSWADHIPREVAAESIRSIDELKRRDLHPNGEMHEIAVAYLYEDGRLHAIDSEYWARLTEDYRNRRFTIEGDGPFRINAVVNGDNTQSLLQSFTLHVDRTVGEMELIPDGYSRTDWETR